MEPQARTRKIIAISIKNIILNTLLSALKITAGLLSNSLAVLSDGFNSLSDVATTVALLIGSHFTKTPGDEEHQYGHEKIESVTAMLIALFLGAVAVYTVYESILRLFQRGEIGFSYFALASALISAGVKYYMYRSTDKKATEIESDSLKLIAVDFRFDVFLSCAVFAGVLLAMLGLWFFEPIAAILASSLLLVTSLSFIGKAIRQLTDRAADEQTVAEINRAVISCDGVRQVDLLMTRLHGSYIYVDIEISVDADMSVRDGHVIAQRVHDKLESETKYRIKHCNVHVNPFLSDGAEPT